MIRIKILGACNADKVDVIKECDRQLQEQTSLKGIVENFEYKGCITQRKKNVNFPKNKC